MWWASKTTDYKELESTINNDLYKVKEYFDTNKLSLNVPSSDLLKMYILGNKVTNFKENSWLQKCDDVMLKGLFG